MTGYEKRGNFAQMLIFITFQTSKLRSTSSIQSRNISSGIVGRGGGRREERREASSFSPNLGRSDASFVIEFL